MKLILDQATFAITEIHFVPGPFRCQIEQQHLDFAVAVGTEFHLKNPTPPGAAKADEKRQMLGWELAQEFCSKNPTPEGAGPAT